MIRITVLLSLAAALAACGQAAAPAAVEPAVAPPPRAVTARQVLEVARSPGARCVVVNVWATSCAPCVEELPAIARLAAKYGGEGLRVVLVSSDFGGTEDRIVPLLTNLGVTFPTYLLEEPIEALLPLLHEEWTGVIPMTVVFDEEGNPRHWWEGKATHEEFEEKVLDVLGRERG